MKMVPIDSISVPVAPSALRWHGTRGVSEDAHRLQLAQRRAGLKERQSQSVDDPMRRESLQKLLEAISLASGPGWDNGEGAPITPSTRDEAERFLEALPDGLWPTDIYPESEGDLAFEWYGSRNRLLIVSFDGLRRAIYVTRLGGEQEAGQVSFPDWATSVPTVITFHIRRFFALADAA